MIASQPLEWRNFDSQFEMLRDQYAMAKKPVAVNFRDLVPLYAGVDRATHLLHSYPAKLLVNIPVFFLNCSYFQVTQGAVLDPFCGTGTVLVEGLLAGRQVIGADSNPLARLISKTKVTPIAAANLEHAYRTIENSSKTLKPTNFTPVLDPAKWFSPGVLLELGCLLSAIRQIADRDTRRFMEVCFSACIRKVSLADPRMSVPVRPRAMFEQRGNLPSVAEAFARAVTVNSARLQRLNIVDPKLLGRTKLLSDARALTSGAAKDVSLIITSPPYLGAQKYIRAASLSIGWLGLAPDNKLRRLERQNIGREHFPKSEYENHEDPGVGDAREVLRLVRNINPLRAHIAATYLSEMRAALKAAISRLRIGGHLVLIIGNNTLCGHLFDTSLYLRNMVEESGLILILELVDDIRSRGLMTRRNKTAGIISREHILVFSLRGDLV